MKRLLFVYNPYSGSGKIVKRINKIVKIFHQAGYDTELYPTKAASDGKEKIIRDGKNYDRVVVAGGDGTLNELVNAIMQIDKSIEVGYLPAGTVNDFAHTHRISKNPLKAAKVAVSENIKSIDVGDFNGKYFSYVAATGFGTKASYLTTQKVKRRWKFLAYVAFALKDLNKKALQRTCRKMKIIADGQVMEGDFVFAAISNSFSIAGMKNLTDKNCVLDDGKLEGLFLPLPKKIKTWRLILKAFFTRNYKLPGLMFISAEKFEISCENCAWTLDGENGGEYTNIVIEAKPKALHIALPQLRTKKK